MANETSEPRGSVAPQADEVRRRFGETVRRLRQAHGWSQAELAQRLTVAVAPMHQTTVAKLEAGGRPTSMDELIALSGIFGVPPGELVQVPAPTELAAEVRSALTVLQAVNDEIKAVNLGIAKLYARRKRLKTDRGQALQTYQRAMKEARMPPLSKAQVKALMQPSDEVEPIDPDDIAEP